MHYLLLSVVFFISSALAHQTATPASTLRVNLLPGWEQENHLNALQALVHSCGRFTLLPDDRPLHQTRREFGTAKKWKQVCARATNIQDAKQAKQFFENNFVSRRIDGQGLFTGYYVANLRGSPTPSSRYRYPIYTKPAPAYLSLSRQDIDKGALSDKAQVLVWVDDPVELFFLHVQGSGIVTFEDGSSQMVGFDSKNVHPYRSIGGYMVQQSLISREEISSVTIKQWLYANPERIHEVLWQNPSYIFFTFKDKPVPIGGEGVPLTPHHSLAVDKEHLPYGVPLWVNTTLSSTATPWQRLMIAQDTGSAIKGKVRGDIFFGAGGEAETLAGLQKSYGTYYVLLPR